MFIHKMKDDPVVATLESMSEFEIQNDDSESTLIKETPEWVFETKEELKTFKVA